MRAPAESDRERPEEGLLGRAEQEPVAVFLAQEVEPVADECDAVLVTMGDDLERAVAFPHATIGPESLDDGPDQRPQVEVGRCLPTKGIKRAHLDVNLGVFRKPTEG